MVNKHHLVTALNLCWITVREHNKGNLVACCGWCWPSCEGLTMHLLKRMTSFMENAQALPISACQKKALRLLIAHKWA
jgi:hypothetical protein